MADVLERVKQQIQSTHVLMYSSTTCPFCKRAKKLFDILCVAYTPVETDVISDGNAVLEALKELTGQETVPNIFINGKHVGGCDSTIAAHSRGDLSRMIIDGQQARDSFDRNHAYDYDLVVIGGGSGGLACSKEAAEHGARVACLDYIKPTPLGTSWGLGGTCVNVGCIPKKLMHQAALLGQSLKDAKEFGWEVPESVNHSWVAMVDAIQNHIGSLNFGYRVALRNKGVKYINALGQLQDAHTIKMVSKKGKEETITTARIVLATGGRPKYPDIPGAREYGITSDDLFSLKAPPMKTLVVGASYVALECAGFLAGIGCDVTCMVRSIFLRGFDQQMAEKAGAYMEEHGVKFIRKAVPTKIELVEDGTPRRLKVEFEFVETKETSSQEFNTVLFAIGRDPDTKGLGLENAGVVYDTKSGYVPGVFEQTNVPHIYVIGDILKGKLELTPLAIQAGRLLAKRLFSDSRQHTDYINVPTTIFTPLEYGCIGLAEEDAQYIYGADDIEVFHANFQPLEFTVAHRSEKDCYCKLVCHKSDNNRVLGFHVLGPNAGEVTQGYGVAMRLRATKQDFDATIGIHPTCSEQFTTLTTTKSSGEDVSASGC
eukprot:Em0001g2661a